LINPFFYFVLYLLSCSILLDFRFQEQQKCHIKGSRRFTCTCPYILPITNPNTHLLSTPFLSFYYLVALVLSTGTPSIHPLLLDLDLCHYHCSHLSCPLSTRLLSLKLEVLACCLSLTYVYTTTTATATRDYGDYDRIDILILHTTNSKPIPMQIQIQYIRIHIFPTYACLPMPMPIYKIPYAAVPCDLCCCFDRCCWLFYCWLV
jgi:hypothetical protein